MFGGEGVGGVWEVRGVGGEGVGVWEVGGVWC